MFPLLENISLNADQSLAATRLLLRIAQVDGAKTDEEVALIRGFHDSGRDPSIDWPAFETLQEAGPDADLAGTFAAGAERDLVVATCLMVAYADGVLSAEELAAVRGVADEIGTPAGRVDEILALVKDYMLGQLARLPDAGSLVVVARELG
ncbi:MAG: hypothetical protein V5B32_08640 [Candidatus Accumulibacter sp. UW26]|jgi:uncharacterized tellurite resistance protein B-like protein